MDDTGPPDPSPGHDPLEFMDGAQQLIAVTSGYRAMAEAAGFSPAVAEQMALHLHVHLIAGVFAKKG